LDQLVLELDYYKTQLGDQEIKSIYFGGGTPNLIGADGMERIINHISTLRDIENLMELSIEMNPYPQEEIYAIIQQLNRSYKKFPRIRYSFGIQSLDDEVLKWAGRPCTFP